MKMVVNKDDIKNSCDMVDVAISLGIEMEKKGLWYIRCPYHFGGRLDKHIGNCYISKDHRYFKCESCGNGGDVLKLVEQVNNCSFFEAIKYLSAHSGVDIEYVEEGEEYQQNGTQRRAVRVISYKDQEFLGIKNNSIFEIRSLTNDLYDVEDHMSLTDQNGLLVCWAEKSFAESSPLQKLASSDQELYCKLVKSFCKKKYDSLTKIYEQWKMTEFGYEAAALVEKDIYRLRDIYESVGGEPMKIKLPTIK